MNSSNENSRDASFEIASIRIALCHEFITGLITSRWVQLLESSRFHLSSAARALPAPWLSIAFLMPRSGYPERHFVMPIEGPGAREGTPCSHPRRKSSSEFKKIGRKLVSAYIERTLDRDPGSALVLPLQNSVAWPVCSPFKEPSHIMMRAIVAWFSGGDRT